jgi:hypothetical protein
MECCGWKLVKEKKNTSLWEEVEAVEVGFGPVGLVSKHAFKGFGRKGVSGTVKRNRHLAVIGVTARGLETGRLTHRDYLVVKLT